MGRREGEGKCGHRVLSLFFEPSDPRDRENGTHISSSRILSECDRLSESPSAPLRNRPLGFHRPTSPQIAEAMASAILGAPGGSDPTVLLTGSSEVRYKGCLGSLTAIKI